MTVHTENSTYVLTDLGDGAFLVSGDGNYYRTPTKMRLEMVPVVGQSMFAQFLEGEKLGRHMITSRVKRIIWR